MVKVLCPSKFPPTLRDQSMGTLKHSANRHLLRQRAAALMEKEVCFIHSREFAGLSEERIEAEQPSRVYDSDAGFEGENAFSDLSRSPLLTQPGEQHLFRKMNFLKYRANAHRATLNPSRPSLAKVQEIERLLGLAEQTRAAIVEANLRLVYAIAHKFANNPWEYDEYVSEGNLILVNAVDKFDYCRGFRFSTYATHAVQRHFFRLMQRRQRRKARELTSPTEILGEVAVARDSDVPLDHRIAEQLISRFDECLDERERIIIEERFGLVDSQTSSETLKSVAEKVGLSKERVRQLQMRAIQKLQDLAVRMNLRLEPSL